ncbi:MULTISPECIES: L-lactate MFS transporter [Burkholderia]|uniref:L-lactate MFS transporter n=1 Tax=Burkholderia TaxID=32008 RepID=UPI0008A1EA30|nr:MULTISPECIES: OFA family MFS transporter [Burkholderia]MBJ9682695.1 OFA family MFS transporter [Burkholderia multivorans]MDR8916886.1 putative MFS-type transporter YhjX [Burkholderia multivorans]MDR8921890.1 putative MFS-type transporter YhjX [Burkholderia multivorans]MDR8965979.1 putative MFS-type transporter YhjX [Burkholderia multivorans]MDR8988547.1 putative MFS-type transporter YhjX [Burkholderia multivorans]
MSSVTDPGARAGAAPFFSKEATIAQPGFSRWMVPPAALAVHLCIGQAYAFSVFNGPLTKVIGITESAPDDWSLTTLGWIFSLAIFFLGLSAAFAGKWLERVGPRRTMFTAACCFGGGFLISALGVKLHQIMLLYLGYGVVGGIGLGLGYVSPVSTLIRWFPDRRGMATGMAIMGFGGGAMIAAPMSVALMNHFKTATSVGVAETFVVLGIAYFISMSIGALAIRVPAAGWKPAGWTPPAVTKHKMITSNHVHIDEALKTPQFYLIWLVLFLNVTAGIGIIGQASVMIQESFKGAVSAAAAAGFVGLLSLFNMGGRFVWASASDWVGRKNTYFIFFAFGAVLYFCAPLFASSGQIALFVLAFCLILSMYGGGFSTVPAYLADMFGTAYVGGIHGRLLTAWAAAGIAGPVLVNYIRAYEVAHGVVKADAYTMTVHIMASLLVIGFICNLFVTRVNERHHMTDAQLDAGK